MTVGRIALVIGGLLLLAVAGVFIHLISAQTPVGVFVPYAEKTLSRAFPGWRFTLGEPTVRWDLGRGHFTLHARDVSVRSGGDAVIAISELTAELGSAGLLSGQLSLKELDVQGGHINLSWSAREVVALARRWRADRAGERGSGPAADAGFDARTAARDAGAAFVSFLKSMDPGGAGPRLVLHDTGLTLTEVESGTVWTVTEATVQAAPGQGGTVLSVSGQLAHEERRAPVYARLWRHGRNEAATLEFFVAEMNPADWTGDIPDLSVLHSLDLPVTADLSLTLDTDGRLGGSSLRLDAGTGQLDIAALYDGPRPVDSMALTLGYNAADQLVSIDSLILEFADTRFEADGVVALPFDRPAVRLQGQLEALEIATLKHYWPRGVAAGGRRWIGENIASGIVGPGELTVRIESDHWAMPRLPREDLDLRFTYRDLLVHYLRPMPPILAGGGRGRLTANDLTLDIGDGTIDGLPIAGSRVRFDRLSYPGGHLAYVTLNMRGALPELLTVIDHEPLGYITEFGLDPGTVDGDAEVSAQIDFPLSKDLMLADVTFDIRGTMANMTSRDLIAGAEVSDGFLDIVVTGDELRADGTALISDLPVEIQWTEQFEPSPGQYPTRLTLTGTADDTQLPELDPDFLSFTGWLPFKVALAGFGPDVRAITSEIDLTPLSVESPVLNWAKNDITPGQGRLVLSRNGPGAETVDFRLTAERLDLDGTLTLADRQLSAVRLNRAVIGENRFSATFERRADHLALDLDAQVLDLRGALKGLFVPSGPADDAVTPEDEPDLVLSAHADTILMMDGVEYAALELQAQRHDGIWDEADILAVDEAAVAASVTVTPDGPSRHVRLATGDAGRLARGMGIFGNARGGALTIEAGLTGQGEALEMDGEARMTDLTVVRTSALPSALEAQSPAEQFNELVGEQGLEFRRLSLPFRLEDGVIDIEDAYANGPRLGLTLQGQVDRGFSQVHVNGVIVPAYRLNALLGNIPLVGGLLTGGEGQGLFALTYRMSGDMQNPSVEINPLSALAPGILRRLFQGSKGTLPEEIQDPDDAPSDEPPNVPENR